MQLSTYTVLQTAADAAVRATGKSCGEGRLVLVSPKIVLQ